MRGFAYADRRDAGRRLAEALADRPFVRPLVLAIPRGGVAVGLELATALGAELDVVLARKLRAPLQPEFAIGAISEDGEAIVDRAAATLAGATAEDLRREQETQRRAIEERRALFRAVRPAASPRGRTVIVTDDGIATGATMEAALRTARAGRPHELVVAVPVAAPDSLRRIAPLVDRVVCLLQPDDFRAVGQYYADFAPVEDDEAVRLLDAAVRRPLAGTRA